MTYSIVAYDDRTGAFGAAVKASLPCVGGLVPHVSRRGAVCTQAFGNIEMGIRAMQLLDMGVKIGPALRLAVDEDYAPEFRQIHGVGEQGETAAFTGENTLQLHGHRQGRHYSVAGNIMAALDVLEAIAEAFESGGGQEFASRLIEALAAGEAAGGEALDATWPRPGSAAVVIAAPQPEWHHNLRVDASQDPLGDLRRVYGHATEAGTWAGEFFKGTVMTPIYWRVSRDPQPPPDDASSIGSAEAPEQYSLPTHR